MTIDLNRYRRAIKPICKTWADREHKVPKHELCGSIAIATNCPIIAIGYYMSELYGMTEELQSFLTRLIAFYQVDDIVGKLEDTA